MKHDQQTASDERNCGYGISTLIINGNRKKNTSKNIQRTRILYSLCKSMIEFILWLLWLFYSQPAINTWSISTGSVDTWSIERQMNFQAKQKQIIIEDYFIFADKIWKIKYARGCAGELTPPTRSQEKQKRVKCSDNAFDCGWIMKAYAVTKGLISEKNMMYFNSKVLYDLGVPKDPRKAERGDFMYRKWIWSNSSWNRSTHFSVVSRPISWNSLRIYDNYNWNNKNELGERELKVYCNKSLCYYAWIFKIYVATNGLVEIQKNKKIEVKPFIVAQEPIETWSETKNPLWYSILIKWFPYDSDANRRANLRYKWTNGDISIVGSFKIESWFNKDALWKKGERWLCQLLPNKTNNVRIKDARRSSGDFQAKICLEKRLAVPIKSKIRFSYNTKETQKQNIIFIK